MKILGRDETNFHLNKINLIQRSAVRDLEVVLCNLWIRVLHDNRDMKPTAVLRQSAELAQIAVFDGSTSFEGPNLRRGTVQAPSSSRERCG